jgi:hypothetical protein
MKTGTKIAIGIGGLVLVGGLIFLMTRKKEDRIAEVDEIEGQPDRKEDENPVEVDPVASEYGGRTIFDSGVEGASINDLVKNNREPQPVEKDWSQDPYYYI